MSDVVLFVVLFRLPISLALVALQNMGMDNE